MTAPTRLEQLEAERDAYRAEAMSLRACRSQAEAITEDARKVIEQHRASFTEAREKARLTEAYLRAKLAATEAHLVRLKIEVRALRRGRLG